MGLSGTCNMQRIRTPLLIAAIAVVLMAGALLVLSQGKGAKTAGSQAKSGEVSNVSTKTATSIEGENPAPEKPKVAETAVVEIPHPPETAKGAERDKLPPQNYGRSQPVKVATNVQVASVAEALKNKNHPERVSVLFAPTIFDRAAFEANPDGYLNVIEPGRCMASAQPGPDVPVLKAVSDQRVSLSQGESVKLTVKGAPLAPVSLTSLDLATFADNKLNAITVRADKEGVATVTLVATPGALNDVHVLAASPMASSQVRFTVEIQQAGGGPNVAPPVAPIKGGPTQGGK